MRWALLTARAGVAVLVGAIMLVGPLVWLMGLRSWVVPFLSLGWALVAAYVMVNVRGPWDGWEKEHHEAREAIDTYTYSIQELQAAIGLPCYSGPGRSSRNE